MSQSQDLESGNSMIALKQFEKPVRVPSSVPVEYAQPAYAKAGETSNWILKFTVSRDIEEGREFYFYAFGGRNNKGEWGNFQSKSSSEPGYVEITKENGTVCPSCNHYSGGILSFVTPSHGFKNGEVLLAHVGGIKGATAPIHSLPSKMFLLLTSLPQNHSQPGKDQYGDVLFGKQLNSIFGACLIHIIGLEATRLQVFVPSYIQAGENFNLFSRPEDRFANTASDQTEIIAYLDGKKIDAQCDLKTNSACRILQNISINKPGVYRFEVCDKLHSLKTFSNPIKCFQKKPDYKLFWGVIHGHTEISDGAGSLNNYFSYMRDECGLDFGATADHDHLWETSDEMWRLTQETIKKYNRPGDFTAFLGYEWAKWRQNGDGDRNVLYLYDDEPMFRSDDGRYPNPKTFFEALKNKKAIVIPHHTAENGNFCDYKDHDIEKERLIEIYSSWGSSERGKANPYPVREPNSVGYVQRALELGWQVGFTAGGDDHKGHPGDQTTSPGSPTPYKAGLFAVYAKENTRQAIWDAMWNRRCYGTTGTRIIVEFQINGNVMGSVIDAAKNHEINQHRKILIQVHGTNKIKSIELVRNNHDIVSWENQKQDVTLEYNDTQPLKEISLSQTEFCQRQFTFYYLRISLIDGELAWASPIWFLL